MANNIAVHHLHKRKRIHEKHEVYPHPDKWKNRLDKIIYFIAIIGSTTIEARRRLYASRRRACKMQERIGVYLEKRRLKRREHQRLYLKPVTKQSM